MDKLKYIKLENEDGSYSESIPLSVDGQYVDINGTSLTNVLENTATKIEVQAVASGSPAGVYSTVEELISANPDHSRIYVVTFDGHWYYYSTAQNTWLSGGIYQATIENYDTTLTGEKNVPNSKSIGDKINDYYYRKNWFVPSKVVDNYVINSIGVPTANENTFYLDEIIPLKKDDTIYYQYNGQNKNGAIQQIIKVDRLGNFITRVANTSGSWKADEDCFIKINFSKYPSIGIPDYMTKSNISINQPSLEQYQTKFYSKSLDLAKENQKNIEDISHQYNFFDANNSFLNGNFNAQNQYVANPNLAYLTTNLMECVSGDTFNISYFGTSSTNHVLYQVLKYDLNGIFIERTSVNTTTYTADFNGFVRFNINRAPEDDIPNSLVISKNEIVTEFYPYRKYIISGETTIESDVKIHKNSNSEYQITFGDFNVNLFKTINEQTNANNWNIGTIKKGSNIIVPTGTDILGPVKINDNTDFIGGVHGDEITDNITIAINNNSYDISDITSTLSGKNLTLIMKSTVYDQIATDKAFDRYVTIIFTPNKIHVSNTFKAIKNLTLERATNGGLIACRNPIIKDIIFNNSYYSKAPTTSINNSSKINTCATINTIYGSVTVNNIKGHDNNNYMGMLNVFTNEDPMRCKIYFDTYKSGSYSISVGDLITGEFEYIFS